MELRSCWSHVDGMQSKPHTLPSTNHRSAVFELISPWNSDVSIFLNTDWSALLPDIKIPGYFSKKVTFYVHEFLWAAASAFRHLGHQCMIKWGYLLCISRLIIYIDVPYFNSEETSTKRTLFMEIWCLTNEYGCSCWSTSKDTVTDEALRNFRQTIEFLLSYGH